MNNLFADRIKKVPRSFIREILKVAADPEIISFAGGLPNPDYFPINELKSACTRVLQNDGKDALQYSTTEGYLPLREYIATKYKKEKDLEISPEQILITSGSQQGLDLLAKVFINEGDNLLIETPGYLGAIQAFSLFRPQFKTIPLLSDGADTDALQKVLDENKIKLFYAVPNFQNPSGITYSAEKRRQVADILKEKEIVFVEDDPYGALRFIGKDLPSMHTYLKEQSVLLGTFSKTIVPAFRLGWIVAGPEIMDKLVTAKQAADLHTNYFAQRVVVQYLNENDIQARLEKIKDVYRKQRQQMIESIKEYLPQEIRFTEPEGGMFLWLTLPENISSEELFELAIKEKVAFVPGTPFFVNGKGQNTMRLNFSNVNEPAIEEGVKRLARAIGKLM